MFYKIGCVLEYPFGELRRVLFGRRQQRCVGDERHVERSKYDDRRAIFRNSRNSLRFQLRAHGRYVSVCERRRISRTNLQRFIGYQSGKRKFTAQFARRIHKCLMFFRCFIVEKACRALWK